MELEDVAERVEWEARRVAVAFGVSKWERVEGDIQFHFYVSLEENLDITWELHQGVIETVMIAFDLKSRWCTVYYEEEEWTLEFSAKAPLQLMASGLYGLGFEDEGVLSQLPSLSAHEKLELRLSLPREFWPKKWFEEEGATAKL